MSSFLIISKTKAETGLLPICEVIQHLIFPLGNQYGLEEIIYIPLVKCGLNKCSIFLVLCE